MQRPSKVVLNADQDRIETHCCLERGDPLPPPVGELAGVRQIHEDPRRAGIEPRRPRERIDC